MILMEVTPAEKERIEKDRAKAVEYELKKLKMSQCSHEWVFEGRSHNSDYYECHKCGAFKFE